MSVDNALLWGKAKDVLTILVVPALVWVFSVAGTLEDQRGQLREIRSEMADHKEKLARLEDSERQFSVQLARLETRLDAITRTTDEIRDMLTRLIDAQNRSNGSP